MMRVLALFALVLSLAAPARAEELGGLIDRYFAWRGGSAYERMTSYRLDADFKAAGLTGTTSEWRAEDGRTRDEYELGPNKGSAAIGAEDAWGESNGVVDSAAELNVRDTRRLLALDFGGALRGKAGARVALLGTETRDGRSWRVVRVSFGDRDTYDAFLDPETGALLGWRITRDKRERFVKLEDWRLVDGVRMPFRRVESDDNPNATQVVEVRRYQLNGRFGPELFKRPKAVRIATFEGGARGTGPIPFDFLNQARIYIPVTLNGHPVKVLLDSGAEVTVIDKGFAERIGVKFTGKGVAGGTGGQTEGYLAEGVTVKVGNMTLDSRNVGVIDMADVSKRLGIPLPVVLGEDVFKQLIVDIDFDRRTIAFSDPEGFRPPAGAAVVPVRQEGGIRSVPVRVEGHEPIQVDFDLGNGSYFTLHPGFWQAHRMLEDRRHSKFLGGAVGGAREEILASVRELEFAGVTFRDVPSTFTTPGEGRNQVDSERVPGNIGLSVMSRFRLITDYPRDRLYAIPYPDAAKRPFRKDRTGLRFVQEGAGLKVTYVSPGSPAEKAGWKAGEVIAAIDAQPVTTAYVGSELSRWFAGEAGRKVALRMVDGSARTLVLADYF
ncbi:MAG TPA: aspartyl protease family protein [Caulobacteraceae bacterium]|jgi:hypothetical protein